LNLPGVEGMLSRWDIGFNWDIFSGKCGKMWDLEENPDFFLVDFGDFGIWVRAQGRILVMVVVLEDKESEGEKRVSLGWCWCSF
jgi:hypothetical protein